MADVGYMISGTFYPQPVSFRLGDPVLVTEVTGMPFPEFAAALDDDDRANDPTLMLGMIAVAIWQANPRWRRDKVARFVESLPIETIDFVGADAPADADPPTDSAVTSEASAPSSNVSPDAPSEPSSPTSAGAPALATGSPV